MRRNYNETEFWSREKETIFSYLHLLPPSISQTLQLHYFENIPIAEIARMIGKSTSTIRNYHSRGIFLLNGLLKEENLQKIS